MECIHQVQNWLVPLMALICRNKVPAQFFHYQRVWFFSQKKLWLMTLVKASLQSVQFHPLQYTICGIYCGIYYIKMAI
jgi:hypothetical protein